jgi:hypothetical protein
VGIPTFSAEVITLPRDIPGATIQLFDTGHFALETHAKEIAGVIRDFCAS